MELIIKGNDKRVKRLAKELKVRVKRDKLEISIKKQEASKPPVKKEQKQKVVSKKAK